MFDFLHRHTIKGKLFIITAISAIPILLAFLFLVIYEYEQSYHKAKREVLVAVKSIALEHNAQVEGVRNLLITLSQFPEIQQMGPVACSKILNGILVQSPSSMNIGVADVEGNVIATGVKQPLPIKYKINDRKYFLDAVRTHKFSAGEYTVSRAIGKPTLHFALPILDSKGKPRVILYAALDLTRFKKLFDAQHFPDNSAFSLIDSKGVLLYRHPESGNVKPGSPDSPHLWKIISGDQESGVAVDIGRDGVKRVFGFTRLRLNPGDPAYLYVRASVPDKVAIAGAYQITGIILVISLTALAVSLLFSVKMARVSFLSPLEKLSSTVRRVEAGDLSAKNDLAYLEDEIGLLAVSFDAMTDSLSDKEAARIQAEDALKDKNHRLELEISERKKIELELNLNAMQLEEEIAERQKAYEALHHQTKELEAVIEEREAVQQTLEEQAAVLEEEISERTRMEEAHSHLEEQLRQSQKMEAIGLLAGGVAHDFNNILAVIMGYGDMLVRMLPEGKSQDNAVQIIRATNRAAELTKALLAFGRKQTFNLERIDCCQFVAENIKFLRRVIGEDIELVTAYPPTALHLSVDRSQMQQVLMNLATNARDAMPSGGKLTIRIASQLLDSEFSAEQNCERPGYFAVIEVADNGIGMAPETVNRIFEPFFTTKEKDKGTGLGLSMIHGIVAQHNGFIRCTSEPGNGTVFSIYLPLCESCALPKDSEAALDPICLGGCETILLAEDDTMLMDITTSHLELSGYTVLRVRNGVEAVEMFQRASEQIDLVILDAIMPKMTGKSAYDKIKAIRPDVKACFMSGYTTEITSGKAAVDDSVPFISKPVMPNVLLKKVREILDAA